MKPWTLRAISCLTAAVALQPFSIDTTVNLQTALSVPSASAQEKQAAIPFGPKREFTYEQSREPYNFRDDNQELLRRYRQTWGKYFVNPDGSLVAWGVVNQVPFRFESRRLEDTLTLDGVLYSDDGNYGPNITIGDVAKLQDEVPDYVIQNGAYKALGNSGFYESAHDSLRKDKSPKNDEAMLYHRIFSEYKKWLNVDELKQRARADALQIKHQEPIKQLEIFMRNIRR